MVHIQRPVSTHSSDALLQAAAAGHICMPADTAVQMIQAGPDMPSIPLATGSR